MKPLIIFDCDGVLVDSESIAHQISSSIFSQFGYSISMEESIQRFTGMSKTTVRNMILQESGLNIPEEAFMDTHHAVLKAFEKDLMALMNGVLPELKEHKINRCVASSSARDRVIHSLKLTNQFHFFEESHIFTAQQVKHGKPAPDLFLLAAEQMGYDPKNCIVIEDSFAGIQAAQAAHMQVIGFAGGSHARFPWYQEKLKSYNIPLAHKDADLFALIKAFSEEKN